MSGIYIPGMEMPEEGWHKVIKIFSDGTVASYYDSETLGEAIPVPDHGRLIDGDALFKAIGADERFSILEAMYVQSLISDAPIILPADKEGEG